MKKFKFLSVALLAVVLSSCSKTQGPTLDEIMYKNTLSAYSESGYALAITTEDDTDYYHEKTVSTITHGAYDGEFFTLVKGHDESRDTDYSYYYYKDESYLIYSNEADFHKYADFVVSPTISEGYPASNFVMFNGYSPKLVSSLIDGEITCLTYQMTLKDDDSYKYYFKDRIEGISVGSTVYLQLNILPDNRIQSYLLSRDLEGNDAIWAKYTYNYVSFEDCKIAELTEYIAGYETDDMVEIKVLTPASEDAVMTILLRKGEPLYPELDPASDLYFDKEGTRSYTEYAESYASENNKEFAFSEDTTLYIIWETETKMAE